MPRKTLWNSTIGIIVFLAAALCCAAFFGRSSSDGKTHLEGEAAAALMKTFAEAPLFGSKPYAQLRQDIIDFAKHGDAQEKIDPDFPTEILPGLYLGNRHAAKFILANRPPHITSILSLRAHKKTLDRGEIQWKRLGITDAPESDISTLFDEAFAFIEQTQSGILVHCRGGSSRSATIVIAYLMKKFELPFPIAYSYVKKKRPQIKPNEGFVDQLIKYERQLAHNN